MEGEDLPEDIPEETEMEMEESESPSTPGVSAAVLRLTDVEKGERGVACSFGAKKKKCTSFLPTSLYVVCCCFAVEGKCAMLTILNQ